MKRTIIAIACDWCRKEATIDTRPIYEYDIVGPNDTILNHRHLDLHEDCVREFFSFAVLLGHYTDIHIGLKRVIE